MDHDLTSSTTTGHRDRPGPDASGGAADGAQTPAVRLCSPGSVVASIPLMFGFHPENSVVVLGLSRAAGRERVQHGVRIGMEQIRGHETEVARDLMVRLRDHDADEALLIAFAPRGATGTRARPDHYRRVMSAMKAQLAAGSDEDCISVVDAIFTAGGRWWSYMCRNKRCCPPEGTAVPAEPPAALAAVFAGQGPVYESREAMDATFAPYGVTALRRMKTAVKKAAEDAEPWVVSGASRASAASAGAGRTKHAGKQSAIASMTANAAAAAARDGARVPRSRVAVEAPTVEPPVWQDDAVRAAHRLADRLLARCGEGRTELSDAEAAQLLVGMEEWRVRDYLACNAFEEPRAELLLRLMTEVARRAPEPAWRTTPLALAAWAAWALGRTALAQCAIDRALAADATYHFALLIRAGLHHGIPATAVRASADHTRRALFEDELRPSAGGSGAAVVLTVQPVIAGHGDDAGVFPAPGDLASPAPDAAALPAQRSRPETEEARS